jgi:hypothetical protein
LMVRRCMTSDVKLNFEINNFCLIFWLILAILLLLTQIAFTSTYALTHDNNWYATLLCDDWVTIFIVHQVGPSDYQRLHGAGNIVRNNLAITTANRFMITCIDTPRTQNAFIGTHIHDHKSSTQQSIYLLT